MKYLNLSSIFLVVVIILLGCSGSQQFVAIPSDINIDNVPKDTIEVIAEDFEFIPDTIRVHEGTLVILKLKSIDGTHGFDLGAFGIDERLDENVLKVVEFYAAKKGEYGIRCSHFCGIGHLGMTAELIIE